MSRPPKIADDEASLFDLPLHRPPAAAPQGGSEPEAVDVEDGPFGPLVDAIPPTEPALDRTVTEAIAAEEIAVAPATPVEPADSSTADSEAPQISFAMTLPFNEETETAAAGASEAVADAEPVRAGFGSRLAAGLIDLGLILIGLGVAAGGAILMGVPPRIADWPAFLVLGLTFSFLYYVIPLAFWGRSAGMAARKLFVRSDDGRPLSFRQAAQRWLAALVTLAALGLPVLLALTPSSLADRMSGSRTLAHP